MLSGQAFDCSEWPSSLPNRPTASTMVPTSIAAWIINPFRRTSEHNYSYNELYMSIHLHIDPGSRIKSPRQNPPDQNPPE